ncbi:hypothetical protein [Halocatena pleomorpha]|nr:hypothetical protein [Halocatena pleomorpha]
MGADGSNIEINACTDWRARRSYVSLGDEIDERPSSEMRYVQQA